MRAKIQTTLLAAAASLTALGSVPSHAGGDNYDAAADTEGKGPAYFGFVRDSRGSPVKDARVLLTPRSGDPVTINTNVLGLYRSHIRKGVSPENVVVSCEKDGFKQSQVVRRKKPGTSDMFIEINCTLTKL